MRTEEKGGLALAVSALALSFLTLAVGRIEPDILVDRIHQYLDSKSVTLGGYSNSFRSHGVSNHVDPRLVIAIAGAETSFGNNLCSPNNFNAWNWFWGKVCANSPFQSWHEGISTVTKFLRRSYLDQGLVTIPAIRKKYCAESCGDWVRNVTLFYVSELGGQEDDLAFQH